MNLLQAMGTAALTIFGGAFTLALAQAFIRGFIEPALELKKTIGAIANDLDFYANKFNPRDPVSGQQPLSTDIGLPTEQDWRDRFRAHGCSLRERLAVIVWYRLFERLFRLPPKTDVRIASAELIGHANRPADTRSMWSGGREDRIKQLLRIET